MRRATAGRLFDCEIALGKLVEHRLSGFSIRGYSVAGEETVIAVPELNLCFDVGRAPAEIISIDHVFLSHGHMDHAAGLAYYFSQRNFVGNAPGCVLAPKHLVEPIRDLLKVWSRIEGHPSPAKIVGMDGGDRFGLRKGLVAEAFNVNHRAAALGYAILDVRHKLKAEFQGKSGPELVALKREGVVIENVVEVPLMAYCGDTAEGAFLDADIVRRAKILFLECSFFEADHVRRAREGYHMHVRDVARILPRLENEHVVLHHGSRRTSLRDAKATLAKMAPAEALDRVTFLMDRRRGQAIPRNPNRPESEA